MISQCYHFLPVLLSRRCVYFKLILLSLCSDSTAVRCSINLRSVHCQIANQQFLTTRRLHNCNYVDFLQIFPSDAYTLTEAETGQEKTQRPEIFRTVRTTVPRRMVSGLFLLPEI